MNVITVRDDLFPLNGRVTTADDDTQKHNFPDADWVEEACESIDNMEENVAPDSEWLEEARISFLGKRGKYVRVRIAKPSLS